MATDNFLELLQVLTDKLSQEELRVLCFALGVDYEELPSGGKSIKMMELLLYLQRREKLSELEPAVKFIRPDIVLPSSSFVNLENSYSIQPETGVQLSREDFDRLVGLLAGMPEFRSETTRLDFFDDVFAGSPRKAAVLGLMDLSGNPRVVAVRTITRLTQFGQDEPGQETLGVMVNKLLSYIGGGENAQFLRGLFDIYPLNGEPASTRGIDDWRGNERQDEVQEKIIGENTLRDILMLELALEAAKAVVRIRTGSGLGTGFLAGSRMVMTNHHVIGSPEEAVNSMFTFNYQLDRQKRPMPVQTTRALPEGLFYSNPDLDITVVEIEEVPDQITPLTLTRTRVQRDERVNIIQHPGGHYKKISMQNNFVAFSNAQVVQYLTTTEPGSSGSPVFNNDFLVVGIHHSGGNILEPDSDRHYLRNAGSTMTAVLDDIRTQAPQIYEKLNSQ